MQRPHGLARGEGRQPGALYGDRDRASDVDDYGLGLLDGRPPYAGSRYRHGPGCGLPSVQRLQAGEGGQRTAAVASDDRRHRHLAVLLALAGRDRVLAGPDGDDRH